MTAACCSADTPGCRKGRQQRVASPRGSGTVAGRKDCLVLVSVSTLVGILCRQPLRADLPSYAAGCKRSARRGVPHRRYGREQPSRLTGGACRKGSFSAHPLEFLQSVERELERRARGRSVAVR